VRYFVLLLALFALTACQSNGKSETPAAGDSAASNAATPVVAQDAFEGEVVETMNAGGYTYVHVDTGSEQIWAAGPEQEMPIGTVVAISKAMPMEGFHSPALERDFDLVYFVNEWGAAGSAASGMPAGHGSMAGMPSGHPAPDAGSAAAVTDFSGIDPADQTVVAIYTQKADLAGQPVKVRGKVVKALSGIMGTNWLHIQDGTGAEGTRDLTVTSETLAPVGSTVVVEGQLTVDKDFGAGYSYPVIIENAKVTVE